MSAGNYTIQCEVCATFSLAMTWQDSSGSPINLTNYVNTLWTTLAQDVVAWNNAS